MSNDAEEREFWSGFEDMKRRHLIATGVYGKPLVVGTLEMKPLKREAVREVQRKRKCVVFVIDGTTGCNFSFD